MYKTLNNFVNKNLESRFKKEITKEELEDDGGESRYLEAMDRADRNYQTEW